VGLPAIARARTMAMARFIPLEAGLKIVMLYVKHYIIILTIWRALFLDF